MDATIKRAAQAARPLTHLDTLLDLRRRFLGFLERRIGDREQAEDILQSAYLRALDADRLPEDSVSSVAWFYRILRNAIIDHYRRKTAEQTALDRWAKELEQQVQPEPLLEDTVCHCLGLLLETLPPAYASLLRAVDFEDQSLVDFARQQGISAGNAAVRAHRARAALRKSLLACCGACADHQCTHCTCAHRRPLKSQSVR